MSERLSVCLPPGTRLPLNTNHNSEMFKVSAETELFIFPPSEQDLEGGFLALGVMDGEEPSPQKLFIPIAEGQEELLRGALEELKEISGQRWHVVERRRLNIVGKLMLCTRQPDLDLIV